MVRPCIGALAAASITVCAASAQESAFEVLSVTEKIKLQEHINETSGTMSGALRPTIRTNELFSAIQLIHRTENAEIKMANLRNAPITVPAGLSDAGLKLCTEVRTINGFYSAIGASGTLAKQDIGDRSALGSLVETSESHMIDSKYTEDLMLMRSFVAPNCVQARSQYYVPLYFSKDPTTFTADTFLAVFEIGNASIEADLHGVDSTGQTSAERLVALECTETARVDVGFDCTFDLAEIDRKDYVLFELRISIEQPHRSKPLSPVLRIGLPNVD